MSEKTKEKPTSVTPAMNDANWTRWVMQTARSWDDISNIINKTGVDSIDNDHKQMTEVVLEINSLIDVYESGEIDLNSIHEQGRILQTLYSYASRHFDREIEIIEKFGLPGLEVQKTQHKLFLDMLTGFIEDFNEGRLAVSLNLKSAVLEWWVRHINTVDTNTFSRDNWTQAAIDNARTWDDVVEIIRPMGNELLDVEHREMTEIALGLMQFVDEDQPNLTAVDQVFVDLLTCAHRHFGHEEDFLRAYDLPDLADQEKQHEHFIAMLENYRKSIQAGDRKVDRALQSSILKWWVNHINVVDYNAFSLEKQGYKILSSATSWEQAKRFIHRTGNETVDDDHKAITEHILMIDGLIDAMTGVSGEGSLSVGYSFFQELYVLCQKHFEHEEAFMRAADYPGYALHKEQHDRFLMSLTRYRKDFASGRAVASHHMKNFILKWWVEHIKEFDMRAFGGRHETASEWATLGQQGVWMDGGAE